MPIPAALRDLFDPPDEEEKWVPVVRYKGLYEVSNYGRVKSLGRWKDSGRGMYWLPGRLLSNGVGRSNVRVGTSKNPGYPRVGLTKADGSSRACLVHVLVLEAFVGPRPFPEADCRHLDGDADNNWVGNLAWGTKKENMADKVSHGTNRKGDNHQSTILSNDGVRQVRERCAKGERQNAVARSLGISYQLVNDILHRRKRTDVA